VLARKVKPMKTLLLVLLITAILILVSIISSYGTEAVNEIESLRTDNYISALAQSNASLRLEIASLTAEIEEGQEIANTLTMKPLGSFEVTHYAYNSGFTKSGTKPTANRTVATDPAIIPTGSLIYVEGYGLRYAEDTGSAIVGNVIDEYLPDEQKCIELGRIKGVRVWILQ